MNQQANSTGDQGDLQAIVAKFGEVRKAHPNYSDALDRTMTLIESGCNSRVVILAGPTGVGKSTLGKHLLRRLRQQAEAEPGADRSHIPAALVTATPPHGSSFGWKDLYVRTLEEMQEPLMSRKVWPSQLPLFPGAFGTKSPAESMAVDPLRRQLETAFRNRKTRVWIIDEAHHMLLCKDQYSQAMQLDRLKSLADNCGVVLVLIGTYELLAIRDHSAQLTRRSTIVDFPSYRFDQKEGRQVFKSVLAMFVGALPMPLTPLLASDPAYFFEKTAGCVGILHDLLRDALYETLRRGMREISREIVDRVAQPNKAIQRIVLEAALGAVRQQDVGLDVIEALMRKSPQQIVEERLLELGGELSAGHVPAVAARPARSGSGRAVGERAAKRDSVGGPGRGSIL